MKNVSLALFVLATVLPAGCKKQEAKLPTASPAAQPAPAPELKLGGTDPSAFGGAAQAWAAAWGLN